MVPEPVWTGFCTPISSYSYQAMVKGLYELGYGKDQVPYSLSEMEMKCYKSVNWIESPGTKNNIMRLWKYKNGLEILSEYKYKYTKNYFPLLIYI